MYIHRKKKLNEMIDELNESTINVMGRIPDITLSLGILRNVMDILNV
jgi:hypothetical protein